MKIWSLTERDYGDYGPSGFYSSLDKAKDALPWATWERRGEGWYWQGHYIEELEVDDPTVAEYLARRRQEQIEEQARLAERQRVAAMWRQYRPPEGCACGDARWLSFTANTDNGAWQCTCGRVVNAPAELVESPR